MIAWVLERIPTWLLLVLSRLRRRLLRLSATGRLSGALAGVVAGAGILVLDLVVGGWDWGVPFDVVVFGSLAYQGYRLYWRFRRWLENGGTR